MNWELGRRIVDRLRGMPRDRAARTLFRIARRPLLHRDVREFDKR